MWTYHGRTFPAPTFNLGIAPAGSLYTTANDLGKFLSVLFAGGRTPGGQVVGATDSRGYAAVDRILSPENFAATVYAKLGIDPGKILYAPNGRPTHLVSDPTPIAELMS